MTNSQKVIVKTLQKGRDGSTWYCGYLEDIQACKTGDFCFNPEDLSIFRCVSGGLTDNAVWKFICRIEIPDVELPTKVSELENDVGYITEHQDVSGFAKKSTTLSGYGIKDAYTKDETNSKITTAVASADRLRRLIVDKLPNVTAADIHTIYMVLENADSHDNKYLEWMVINGVWEKIGDTTVDLSDYVKEKDISGVIADAAEAKRIAENHKHNDYLKAVVEYYPSSSGGMDADELVVPTALIPLNSEQNAELYNILYDTFAYVITLFYKNVNINPNRVQLAMSYHSASPRMAIRAYHDGWGAWKEINTDVISPTVEITETTDGYNISITDANGTDNIKILHGKNGEDGINGKAGEQGATGAKGEKGDPFTYDDFTAEQLASLKGEKGDTGAAGKDGADGKDGANGADGKTPEKGVDYFTEADKAEMVNAVIAALPTAEGASF